VNDREETPHNRHRMQLDDTRRRLDVGNGQPIYELTRTNRVTCFFWSTASVKWIRPLSCGLNSYAISHYLTPQEEEEGAVRAPSSDRPAASTSAARPMRCPPVNHQPSQRAVHVSCAGSTCSIGGSLSDWFVETSVHLLAERFIRRREPLRLATFGLF